MTILPVFRDTPKTCLRLDGAGDAAPDMRAWSVQLQRVGLHARPGGQPQPVIAYPVHALDCEGRLVFFWDDLLLQGPAGRYAARLIDADGCTRLHFGLDLLERELVIARADLPDPV